MSTNKKRIGIVLPCQPGYSETFFFSKINGLINNGHEVLLFINSDNALKYPDSWRLYIQPRIYNSYILMICSVCYQFLNLIFYNPNVIRKFLKLEKNDKVGFVKRLQHIYINSHILKHKLDWLHFGFATTAINRENVAEAIGAKLAVSFRGYDINLYPVKKKNVYTKLWKKVDYIHTISNDLHKKALHYGLPADIPWKKIPPALEFKQFYRSKRNFFDDNPVSILTIGRLTWIKGYEYAINAMKLLYDKGVPFTYTIIGAGEDWERLNYARHQLSLEDEVEFMGKVKHKDIPSVMRSCDIYLQPSLEEGFCNAVLEAQAMGMLCICSDVGGLRENIIHNQTGWLVPARNPEAIAEKIIELYSKPKEILLSISENARKRVREEFNINDQIQRFIHFYNGESVLEKRLTVNKSEI